MLSDLSPADLPGSACPAQPPIQLLGCQSLSALVLCPAWETTPGVPEAREHPVWCPAVWVSMEPTKGRRKWAK